MKRKQAGFSLIELLIVVAIILIISAIALPNLIVARMSANEASAVQSLRTIQSAETAYATTFPSVGFSATLMNLSGGNGAGCSATPAQACLIDSIPATPLPGRVTVSRPLWAITSTPIQAFVVRVAAGAFSPIIRVLSVTTTRPQLRRTIQPFKRISPRLPAVETPKFLAWQFITALQPC